MIFLESPWPILFIGIAVEAALAFALLRSGRGILLLAMIGTAVLVLIGLLVERFVVTDRKAIRNTLDEAAAAVVANNVDRLLDCISPSAVEVRREARIVLSRVEVEDIGISNLEIRINRLTAPPTARVGLRAYGKGRDRSPRIPFPYERFSQPVIVELRLEGGRWLVTGYDDYNAGP
jgi:hypothetical protein